MSDPKFGLLAIGNALVDVLAPADEAFLEKQARDHGMMRGAMTLIDELRAEDLYDAMGQTIECSGGSAGNTMAGFGSFGGKGAYIGKVASDHLGRVFSHDMKAQGVTFRTESLDGGVATGRCLVLVAEGGERTMNTFLGAAVTLGPDDIDEELVASSQVTYLEGYLYDPPLAKQAFRLAAKTAHDAERLVSLSLSDPFCVGRHRDDFLDLVKNHVDILFANEEELKSLYQTDDFESAVRAVKGQCDIAAVTRSEKGSVIIAEGRVIEIKAAPVTRVVDTTGAGDQYAAGFLYGFTQGLGLEEAGRLGSAAAAEVIGHMGPRPEVKYSTFLKKSAA